MKALIAATLIVALDSFNFVAAAATAAVSDTPEPISLALWGLSLFVVASSLKRRPPDAAPSIIDHRGERSWVSGMLASQPELDRRKLGAGA